MNVSSNTWISADVLWILHPYGGDTWKMDQMIKFSCGAHV